MEARLVFWQRFLNKILVFARKLQFKMTSASQGPVINDQYSGLVDNRCCFCLTLRTGAITTGILNAIVNIAAFTAYVTSPAVQSSWGHPGEAVTNLDISYLVVFTLQIVCDAILIFGALKKIPNHLVPWLWANAVIIAVFLLTSTVFVALMLFFGHLRTSMNHNEFISALAGIGILGGIHMFSWLVVFQFRRNLLEEQRLMARLVATAPPPPSDDIPPQRQERPPSPPPAYDEVTKQRPTLGISSDDYKIDLANESPPEYATAIAMSLAEEQQNAQSTQDTTVVIVDNKEDK